MVLDSAPDELARLAGYLEVVAEKVLIDLVTVSAYEVAGSKIIVPQRVEAERHREEASAVSASSPAKGVTTDGADAFDAAIEKAEPQERAQLKKLVEWARALEREHVVELQTYVGKLERWILLPRLQPDNAGLVSLWNDGGASIQFWRLMFQKRAPEFIAPVEAKAKVKLGQGNTIRAFDDELLALLTDAYRAASKGATSV